MTNLLRNPRQNTISFGSTGIWKTGLARMMQRKGCAFLDEVAVPRQGGGRAVHLATAEIAFQTSRLSVVG
ncbi:hypothetical protein [Planctomycetes bacterium TBK1r]